MIVVPGDGVPGRDDRRRCRMPEPVAAGASAAGPGVPGAGAAGGVPVAAGVVLVGGRSSRMGTPKAALEWHGSTLLYRTAALLGRAVPGPVVVVRAAGQPLPELPAGVEMAEDAVAGRGPIQGILTGLDAVGERAEVAFVCACDLPFLHPAFVLAVLAGLRDPAVDLVLPITGGHPQPLAAGYRIAPARRVRERADAVRVRPRDLPAHLAALLPDEWALLADPALAAADPGLDSLLNVNTPEDYAAARARPAPEVVVHGPRGPAAVRAATLAAAGLPRAPVLLNDVRLADPDPALPLVGGDHLRPG
jgi:molybdopterin-guanine dinucleotide biosynthesis protein A